MDADLPIDAEPAPRRTFTIRSMMLAVVVVAALLGWLLALYRSHRRLGAVTPRLTKLVEQIRRDDPSIHVTGASVGPWTFHALGGHTTSRDFLVTATRRQITIIAEVRSEVFRDGPNRVTFESMGRSETWPYEDLDRGRKVDLRAMFPEAFR